MRATSLPNAPPIAVAACASLVAAATALLAVPSAVIAQRWVRPVPGEVARSFSYTQSAPFTTGAHRGVDLSAPPGAVVRAACAGRVVHAGAVASSTKVASTTCGARRVSYLPLATARGPRGRARPRRRAARHGRGRPWWAPPRRSPRTRPVRLHGPDDSPRRTRPSGGPGSATDSPAPRSASGDPARRSASGVRASLRSGRPRLVPRPVPSHVAPRRAEQPAVGEVPLLAPHEPRSRSRLPRPLCRGRSGWDSPCCSVAPPDPGPSRSGVAASSTHAPARPPRRDARDGRARLAGHRDGCCAVHGRGRAAASL